MNKKTILIGVVIGITVLMMLFLSAVPLEDWQHFFDGKNIKETIDDFIFQREYPRDRVYIENQA